MNRGEDQGDVPLTPRSGRRRFATYHSNPLRLPEADLASAIDALLAANAGGPYRTSDGISREIVALVEGELRLRVDTVAKDEWTTTATRSGFDALMLALDVLGVRAGDVVAAPAFAFHLVGASILQRQATPLWCDVDSSWNISADTLTRAAGRGEPPTCVIAVDNFGTPCDLPGLRRACDEMGASLILDACESLGAVRQSWDLADAICVSYSFSKPIHAMGAGGSLSIRCLPHIQPRLDQLARTHFAQLTMPEVNAAYLRSAWTHLRPAVEALRRTYLRYEAELTGLGFGHQPEPHGLSSRLHAPFIVPAHVGRDALLATLDEAGIEARAQFPRQDVVFGNAVPVLDVTAGLDRAVLSLPSGPELSEAQRRAVVSVVAAVAR